MLDWLVVALANILDLYDPASIFDLWSIFIVRRDCEAHRIPRTCNRQPDALFRVAQVAKLVKGVDVGHRSLMPGRSALTCPSASERQSPRMRPQAILKFLNWHEKRTRHAVQPQAKISGLAIVLTQPTSRQSTLGPGSVLRLPCHPEPPSFGEREPGLSEVDGDLGATCELGCPTSRRFCETREQPFPARQYGRTFVAHPLLEAN